MTIAERAVRCRQLLYCQYGRPNPVRVPDRGMLLLAGVPYHGLERRPGQVRVATHRLCTTSRLDPFSSVPARSGQYCTLLGDEVMNHAS